MPVFVVISRHSPENCPLFNEKTRKVWVNFLSRFDGLTKKHGIKNLGVWSAGNIHQTMMVMEAPSFEALTKCLMEPEALSIGMVETAEINHVFSGEEVLKMLQQAK
jgi:hypothetical protein